MNGETYYEKKNNVTSTGQHTVFKFDDAQGLVPVYNFMIQGGTVKWFNYGDFTEEIDNHPTQLMTTATAKKDSNILTGRVDTDATIKTATKTPIENDEEGIGADLYDIKDIQKFLGNSVTIESIQTQDNNLVKDGKLNTDDYYFTGWKISTNGTCTQPWNMYMSETPKVWKKSETEGEDGSYVECDGAVTIGIATIANGIKPADYVDEKQAYYVAGCENSADREKYNLTNIANTKKFDLSYYSVVAYPKTAIENKDTSGTITSYNEVCNEITATLYPDDGKKSTSSAANSAKRVPLTQSKQPITQGVIGKKTVPGDTGESSPTGFCFRILRKERSGVSEKSYL